MLEEYGNSFLEKGKESTIQRRLHGRVFSYPDTFRRVLVRRRLALLGMIYAIRMRSSSDIARFRRMLKTKCSYILIRRSHPFPFLSFCLPFLFLLCFIFSQGVLPLATIFASRIAFSSVKTRAQNGRGVPTQEGSDVLIIRFTTLAGNSARGHDIKVTVGTRGCMRRGYTRAPAAVTAEKNQFRESSTVRYKTGWPSPFFSQLAENSSPWNSVLLQFRAFSLTSLNRKARFFVFILRKEDRNLSRKVVVFKFAEKFGGSTALGLATYLRYVQSKRKKSAYSIQERWRCASGNFLLARGRLCVS